MKAQLPKTEPHRLKRWQKSPVTRSPSPTAQRFTLHDGPPYANGHLHMGHALNKILKDIVNRQKQQDGFFTHFVPGWDCHGLPIEWKVEEELKKQGIDKSALDILTFRRHCRAYAQKWIDIQKEEFQRLGVQGDWAHAYHTMSPKNEAAIAREFASFVLNGYVYRGTRPVMWSVVEQTALSDAEIDYKEHRSTTATVRFPIHHAPFNALMGTSAIIWTTTPWTLPANRAIAYGDTIDYSVIEVDKVGENSLASPGERLLLAQRRISAITQHAHITDYHVLLTIKGEALRGAIAHHPLASCGYPFPVPMLAANFVDTETGTGLVHIAPSHGDDDFQLSTQHGIEAPETVLRDGTYAPSIPLFAGQHVFKADKPIMESLREHHALLIQGTLRHSYPHSWRSGKPLIFRVTPQWFINMEHHGLREKAIRAIKEDITWYPPTGQARILSMVSQRPDWCVSRQRLWGVPLCLFTHKDTGDLLCDAHVTERILKAMEKDGADCWFDGDPRRFIAPDYDPQEYDYENDILDVWFDSGATHAYALTPHTHQWPADLYLEGSDQHRGWFQSSLLEGCGTRGKAPYKNVLTHGFVLDQKGYKMSKSAGDALSPQKIIDRFGADVLRLWVAMSDSSTDLRIGESIIQSHVDNYRRLRHCFRFILGTLGHHTINKQPWTTLPAIERFILHQLAHLEALHKELCSRYRLASFYTQLHHFCTTDISAFYFDIRKDCLYCDPWDSPKRHAALQTLDILFLCLQRWLSPVLCFTCDEAWEAYCQQQGKPYDHAHNNIMPHADPAWHDTTLETTWKHIRTIRRVITHALERARESNLLGSSLEADVSVFLDKDFADVESLKTLQAVDWAEIAIVSSCCLTLTHEQKDGYRMEDVAGVSVVVRRHRGVKCPRCWQYITVDKGNTLPHGLCPRCVLAEEKNRPFFTSQAQKRAMP